MEAFDVARQAQQGSMAAIIHILNERLSQRGVRTRAVLTDGVLQLLCEANEEAALEQSTLVPQVKEILEEIEPRKLRRVKVFSRIAQEQQMMWLADMARNPDHSILWIEEITLRRSPFWQRLGRKRPAAAQTKQDLSHLSASPGCSPVLRNIVGIVSLCAVSFAAGWAYDHQWRSPRLADSETASTAAVTTPPSPTPEPTTVVLSPNSTPQSQPTPNSPTPEPSPSPAATPAEDAFTQAVRLAEEASLGGKNATTATQWQTLANKWQQASQLMGQVPEGDERYNVARDRTGVYKKNSEVAQQEANKLKTLPTP